jgi:Kef-type K+ transport system membrane component KefB
VIGEIAAGIIIGPSLLGAVAPAVSASLFPADSLAILQMLSQIGVLLFMFVIGVELDASHIRGRTRTAIAVSHFSIAVPFVLGVLLALLLYRGSAPIGVPFHAFALFLGVAMSITAFPVLARILEERQLAATPLGTMALTCAAVDDATAWTLLAFVSAVTTSGSATATLLTMVGLSVAFILLAVYVVRPALGRLLDSTRRADALSREHIALVLGVALLSALTTEVIGIHALFGAFLAGVVMPADATFRRLLRERLETITSVLLMPLFFAFTGLRTEIGLLNDPSDWITCLAIIVVATVGKMGGTIVAARLTGLAWHESLALGALMNTRGLMELIALNVGYDLGILTPEIFAMMVLMALVTTGMTGPLLSLSLTWGRRRTLAAEGSLPRSP